VIESQKGVLERGIFHGRKISIVEERFLSVSFFAPSSGAGSNIRTRWRFGHSWLACQCSEQPLAAGHGTRRILFSLSEIPLRNT